MTAALLRERLARTRPTADPTDVVLPPGSDDWPSFIRERLLRTLRPAGVLIPVIEGAATLSVLLTQRAAELKHHAGQVSFPGGSMEHGDRNILTTALRETHEEVGIPPEAISVIGYLPPTPTVTGYAVTPVVGLVADAPAIELDRSEVEYAFEVPLPFLFDTRNQRAAEREFQGQRIPTVEFLYAGKRIWGATAHMIMQFRKIVIE